MLPLFELLAFIDDGQFNVWLKLNEWLDIVVGGKILKTGRLIFPLVSSSPPPGVPCALCYVVREKVGYRMKPFYDTPTFFKPVPTVTKIFSCLQKINLYFQSYLSIVVCKCIQFGHILSL